MKTLILLAAFVTTQCFAQEASEPSFSSMSRLCQAEGAKISTYGKCLASKLDKHRPEWRESGKGYDDIHWIVSFFETLGNRVKKRELSSADAERLAAAEMQAFATRLQSRQQAEAAEKERQRIAEQERARLAYQQEQDRQRAEEQDRRERALYEYQQAQLRLQQEQLRHQRNQQLIDTGIRLMELGQPRYAPPAPIVFPQETTINIQQPNRYRFIDSSPYR